MQIRSILLSTLVVAASVALGASSASALTIDCATADCLGGVYSLDVASLGGDTYLATYSVDTSVDYRVAAEFLNEIEFKVANDYTNVSVLSGPSGILAAGPLGGRGCNGNNGTFVCFDVDPNLSLGSTYTWSMQFDSTAILDESEWHVGARYTSTRHRRGWVISETAPVPEPGAAMLFGAGVAVLHAASRKRS
ncbi:MAG: hypothetical protein NXI30_21910 [bacterium]|nr:hypothetical protein [bacterium]